MSELKIPDARIVAVRLSVAREEDILAGSVYDATDGGVDNIRMGTTNSRDACGTCGKGVMTCEGHHGHIRLTKPVPLVIFFPAIKKAIQGHCHDCGLRIPPKTTSCPAGHEPYGPDAVGVALDSFPGFIKVTRDFKAGKETTIWDGDRLRRLAEMIVDEPGAPYRIRDLVPTVFHLLPNNTRPPMRQNNQEVLDDLHTFYDHICKANKALADAITGGKTAGEIELRYKTLCQHVNQCMHNKAGGGEVRHGMNGSRGRALAGIAEHLGGKDGRIRNNCMGKRVDFSARTVITPNLYLGINEVGVPRLMAMDLTKPEKVNPYNRARLQKMVDNGPHVYPGAVRVVLEGSGKTYHLDSVGGVAAVRARALKDGDVVHRHIIEGDTVLFNRQPSLHKMNIMSMRAVLHDHMTFQFNPGVCKPFNADFDGDEMNLHLPQKAEASVEAEILASPLRNIISPRHGEPIIAVIQDSLTGSFLLTAPDTRIPLAVMMDMLARWTGAGAFERKPFYTGQEALSFIMPPLTATIAWKSSNKETFKFVVREGVVLEGQLQKESLTAKGGLLHIIHNMFGAPAIARFIADLVDLVQRFLQWRGFSVGLADLVPDAETDKRVGDVIKAAMDEVARQTREVVEGKMDNTTGRSNYEEMEARISKTLKGVESVGSVVMASLPAHNQSVVMVRSGAKASVTNIRQMAATLGQQFMSGHRVPFSLSNRPLPHFSKWDFGAVAGGFVMNSFASGLNPIEFFNHMMAGRDTLIDTATKTPATGYLQRRMIKNGEDVVSQADGTVRMSDSKIVSFSCPFRPECTEEVFVPWAGWSNEQVAAEYGLNADDLAAVCSSEFARPIPDLVPQLRDDRDGLVRWVFGGRLESRLLVPVDVGRIVAGYAVDAAVKTDLTPEEVVAGLEGLAATAGVTHSFALYLRFALAPKKAIVDYRFTRSSWSGLLATIRSRIVQAATPYGESLGIQAAQHIGEPSTQLTLNSFHSAGTSAGTASTQGVPRLEELIGMTDKTMKTPICTVWPLVPGRASAQELRRQLQQTLVSDIVVREWIYPGRIRLEFSRAEMDTRGIRMEDVALRLEGMIRGDKAPLFERTELSDDNAVEGLFATAWVAPGEATRDYTNLRAVLAQVREQAVSGLRDIKRVFLEEKDTLFGPTARKDPLTGQWATTPTAVLLTEGVNLMDLMSFPGVDHKRLSCNSVMDVFRMFGKEAARAVFIREFMATLDAAGAAVLPHHIILVADRLFWPATPTKFDRFGMERFEQVGPIARISFERTDQQLVQSALRGEVDYMTSPSANIMFGQMPQCGTGKVALMPDERKLAEGLRAIAAKPLPQPPVAAAGAGGPSGPTEAFSEDDLFIGAY